MIKKIILGACVVLCSATATYGQTNNEEAPAKVSRFCEVYAQYAYLVMVDRQMGGTYAEVASAATNELMLGLVDMAFEVRLYHNQTLRDKATKAFEAKALRDCLAAEKG